MMTLTMILACATCYGDPNSSQTQGMNLAILTMLGVTAVVLGSFAALFIVLSRRARRAELKPVTT
jgi:integral membrane sensor domain MASE1